ncbi:MAG: AMP-binding protein, partial [Chloroflexi bacterium]|nr:AMP-binding protein [Chloroflexota bacterium]
MDKPWLKFYESGVPAMLDYPDEPLFHVLNNAVEKYPNRPALYFYDERVSYRTLSNLINRFANALIALGVKRGDRVAIHLPNCPQFVIAYYATLRIGAVVAAHSPLYTEAELEHQLNDCGATLIITLTSTYERVKHVQSKTSLRTVICTNIKDFLPPHRKMLFTLFREHKEGHRANVLAGDPMMERLLLRFPDHTPQVEVSADSLALLQYTGGTTGLPKAAMLTHRTLVTNVLQTAHWNPHAQEGREVFLC